MILGKLPDLSFLSYKMGGTPIHRIFTGFLWRLCETADFYLGNCQERKSDRPKLYREIHAQSSNYPKGWDIFLLWPGVLLVLLKTSPTSYCASPNKVRAKDKLLHLKDPPAKYSRLKEREICRYGPNIQVSKCLFTMWPSRKPGSLHPLAPSPTKDIIPVCMDTAKSQARSSSS